MKKIILLLSVLFMSLTVSVYAGGASTNVGKDSTQTSVTQGSEKLKALVDSYVNNKCDSLINKHQEELDDYNNEASLKLYIAYGVAGLAILLSIIAIVLLLQMKNRFRDNVLNVLKNENGKRITDFINKIAGQVNSNKEATSNSSFRPSKIDENQFKNLFEKFWAEKENNEKTAQKKQQEHEEQQQEQKRIEQQRNRPITLYADSIVNGEFNKVKEIADTNETIFELHLNRATDTSAKVQIYSGAHPRILANPSFLEGCEKQLMGANCTRVETIKEGVAQKESDGKWRIKTKPEVKIS